MRVLWITNNPLPAVYHEFNEPVPVNVGWVNSAAIMLKQEKSDIVIGIASFYKFKEFRSLYKNNFFHYLIPAKSKEKNNDLLHHWNDIIYEFKPDIIHIHGTEYSHIYPLLQVINNSVKVVISIQGLVSVIERYYFGGINYFDLLKSITVRDLIRADNVFSQRRNMKKRGNVEREVLMGVKHAIGRTSWDKAHVYLINPSLNYHFCNETLRESFYNKKWVLMDCDRHSIFLSQAHYPIKGIHKIIEALPFILERYPNTKVYVAGGDFFSNRGLLINGFGKYIKTLIEKKGYTHKFIFLGLLSEELMCKQYLKSHVFVLPSAIENSPNSIGEAQLLGVPCISSYVGGTPDMIENEVTGLLYRFEEFEMLAYNICRVFSDDNFANELSHNERIVASSRHNPHTNAISLYDIYKNILNNSHGD